MLVRRLGLSLIMAGAIAVSAAIACSCARHPSAAAQLRDAEVMFVGRAERTATRSENGLTIGVTRFAVERTLKGEVRAERRIEHGMETGGMCGVVFQRGRTYTVIAHAHEGRLVTSSCASPQFPLADYERALTARRDQR